jgi:AraC family transcriptional regulator
MLSAADRVIPSWEVSRRGVLSGRYLHNRAGNALVHFCLSDYEWKHEAQDNWKADAHVLDLALTPRPKPAWASFPNLVHMQRQPVGPMMFIPAGHTLRSGAAIGRLRTLTCIIATPKMGELLGRDPSFDGIDVAKALHLRNPEIEHLLLRVYQELRQPGFACELLIESLGNAIAIALIRDFGLDKAADRAPRYGGLAPWRLRRITERVHADQPAPDLAELAAICGMSVRHLTRAFRAETGTTIAAHVQGVTIERARTRLTDTAMPISEIARRLGFANASSFCYAFRRSTGLRPSELRAIAGHGLMNPDELALGGLQ